MHIHQREDSPVVSAPASMRALVLDAYGAPLRLSRVTRPDPNPGEVLVRVHASGLNPLDTKIRAGRADHARHPLPAVLGIDLAGVVVRVGQQVTTFRPGDAVYGMTGGVGGHQGSLAEYAAVDAALLAHAPRSLTLREAAALPLVVITAWEGLVDRARVAAGHRVLVHGGAGGIGHIAIQIALAHGAHVFATGTSAQRVLIERLGATAIDYQAESVDHYVVRHTGGEGFDIIFDTVGGATLDASFGAVRAHTGHVVSALGWGTHSLAPLSFRGATYSGVFTLLPLLTGHGRAHHGEILQMAARLADEGRLTPVLDPRRLTWETVSEGFAALEEGSATGKLVVDAQI